MIIPPLYGIGAGCPNFRLHPISVSARLRRDGSARQGGFWFQLKLGSATVPVAVGNVPLRTFFHKSVRRDADRCARDARAPHFTRELEKLHPDNRHVKDKIRQQLQVLRDTGLLLHVVRLRFASPRQERGVRRLP
ncbi:MAG: hypothetical protein ACLPYZ_03900 [Limisphaerales bacterium]